MYSEFAILLEYAEKNNKILGTISPNPNFVRLFGGREVASFIHNDNINYKVIIWEWTQSP